MHRKGVMEIQALLEQSTHIVNELRVMNKTLSALVGLLLTSEREHIRLRQREGGEITDERNAPER